MRVVRQLGLGIIALGLLVAAPGRARAADSASLQFTVPAPNPVPAGDRVLFQALAVNTGAQGWAAGSYFWVAEIYDLEEKFLARTDQVSPAEAVASGGVSSISLPFRVPETMVGRRLYRVFLIKDTRTLVESELVPFEVLQKPIPPAPEEVDYRVEGNVTVAYKNSSRTKWDSHSGATTLNLVGKVKESSYLFNAYILHETGDFFDPFIILGTYYAPWGTVYAGDVSPTLSQLSVDGQGMRGGMLEQRKGRHEWAVLGGQTVESQPGNATTNGRFARTLYAAKYAASLGKLKSTINYFLSADEQGSLSSNPKDSNFRGPSLVPEKNSGYGVALSYEPLRKLSFLADLQRNTFHADSAKTGKQDTAYKLEARMDRSLWKAKAYVQRAGTEFVAFGAPATVGDRITFAGNLNLYPASWYSLTIGGNQYRDNLKSDPAFVTTTQRVINAANAFQFRSGTSLNLGLSLNAAKGQPSTALENQTTTAGFGVSQSFGKHNASLSGQVSQFRDKNNLAHDLDTNTVSLATTFALPRSASAAFGVSNSETKDKDDGSKRSSLSVSPSYSKRMRRDLVGQLWGTYTKTKSTSPSFPSDLASLSANTEATWSKSRQLSLTLGLGYNKNDDKVRTSESFNEAVVSTRISYSF